MVYAYDACLKVRISLGELVESTYGTAAVFVAKRLVCQWHERLQADQFCSPRQFVLFNVIHSLHECLFDFQLVLMQVSNDFGFARNYDDIELLSDVENELSDLIAVQIAPDFTDSLSSIAVIALNIVLTSKETVRQ